MYKPIITSLLDADFYKFTMMQLAWKMHPKAWVKFAFTNRTKGVNLPAVIPVEALREQLVHMETIRMRPEELAYLRGLGTFEDGFIDFLDMLQLPEVSVEPDGDTYRIEVEGHWPVVSLWETLVLSIVNELYYACSLAQAGTFKLSDFHRPRAGQRRLSDKIGVLDVNFRRDAIVGPRIVEFGTRRRFNGPWQRNVVERMCTELSEFFAGTSNVLLAKDLGLKPIGTFAHEMYMAYAGIHRDDDAAIRASHGKVLRDWYDYYGESLSVALTDQYGSGFFFGDFTEEQYHAWRGVRHDSGPWQNFHLEVADVYDWYGIDPADKVIVWSDGLDAETILEIDRVAGGNIGCVYGWGTNLTNDVGLKPLSLVMKVVESMGWPVVKLSDNPAKAVGPAEEVARYKRIFDYDDERYKRVECKY